MRHRKEAVDTASGEIDLLKGIIIVLQKKEADDAKRELTHFAIRNARRVGKLCTCEK